ncbi:MAG TPA: hypothetical protein VKA74_17250 [Myxococcota bacterium]|nr:hypothetical protein [Myxococcota bacterium]
MRNLDEALERFHVADLEYAGGLSNHGPMGAEALESIGHQALIPAFLDLYAPRLPPAEPGRVLDEAERRALRGDPDRRADWVATFEALVRDGEWREVVREVVPDLLPGLFASAGHGLLRTAHAVRALEREDSALRRRELARGLAAWAAREQSLPGRPGARATAADRERGLRAFFDALPLLRDPAAREGLILAAAPRLAGLAPFVEAIERAPTPEAGADVEGWLVELAREGAGLYLAHPEARIAYVHGVTLPVALRELTPLLDAESARAGAGFVLQAVAALHSLFGERRQPDALDEDVVRTAEDWDEIRYRAACSIQEHAIKMAEACWRMDTIAPDRVFRLAASDAALRLEGSRSAGGC